MRRMMVVAITLWLYAGSAYAQSGKAAAAPQAIATYAGCLTPLPTAPGNFVLASGDRCYLVPDTAVAKGAGHAVVLKASLLPQQGMQPITLVLKGAMEVKAACTQTCTLQPPGTRGLGPKDKPGPEGATQGLTGNPQPQP